MEEEMVIMAAINNGFDMMKAVAKVLVVWKLVGWLWSW
jgi:hypothetical protein